MNQARNRAPSYHEFATSIRFQRRHILTDVANLYLQKLRTQSESRVLEVSNRFEEFWRAQRGCSLDRVELDGGDFTFESIPYQNERMKPCEGKAIEGRASVKGIPRLYLSSSAQTAVAEVRPSVGAIVTVAHFRANRDLKLFDARYKGPEPRRGPPGEVNVERDNNRFWYDLDRAFSTPVNVSDDEAEYSPTQVITEAIQEAGFDGIVFNSALSEGHNYVLFELHGASVIESKLVEVTRVSYEMQYLNR